MSKKARMLLVFEVSKYEAHLRLAQRRLKAYDLEAEGKRITKWELIDEEEQEWMLRTSFTANGTGQCSECREELATEADFAKHFTVPDVQFLNLGYCPNNPPKGEIR